MCGIVGIVGPGSRAICEGTLRKAVADLRHRGPDACGLWASSGVALGHTRLSIVDLSDTGCQPMHVASGRWTLVYNGEVYNYVELREQLRDRGHVFRGSSDTEVVLAALIEWGEGALDRFNGMWALALWDGERQELFIARDRAGKKPFYYTILPDTSFAFSSEIGPLLGLGAQVGIDKQAAFDFLTQGTYGHLDGRTFFDGIEQLPAAHCGRVRPGGQLAIRRYWEIPDVSPGDRLPYDDTFRSTFRDLMTDAVRLRLRSDVPIGATLSGGLDSSTIVLLVDQLTGGAPFHLFTSLYPGTTHDETRYFDAVVGAMRAPIVHRAHPDESSWREDLLRVLRHQEEPFGDTSIFAHFTLMRAAREAGVPVILSGQGGDELLLGYPSMVTAYLGSLLSQGRPGALVELWKWAPAVGMARGTAFRNMLGAALPLHARDRIRARFVRRMAERVTSTVCDSVSFLRFIPDNRDALSSYLNQVFTRFSIPHLTHYDDRNAMAFSIEGRMPFLDVRLVELMFSVKREALFAGGFTKRVLRESFIHLLPTSVRLRRDKVGFYTPMAVWLKTHAIWVSDVMTREHIESVGVLKPEWYAERLAGLTAGHTEAALDVWRGFIFHLWADRFGVTVNAARRSPPRWSARH